jgi:hypothetical protein
VATINRPRARRVRNAALRLLNRIPGAHRRIALNLSELAIDRPRA